LKQYIIAALAFAVLTFSALNIVNAAPNSNFSWTAPIQYVDGNMIPATDILTYRVYCGNTAGGPYIYSYDAGSAVEAATLDVGSCVQGTPGTYYFVATAYSTDFSEESAFSNEATRTYTAQDLGRVPLPPTLLSVQ